MTEDEEVNLFLHRVLHLRARKGLEPYAEACMISDDCWNVLDGPPPTWAVELAEAGESASRWCPIVTPSLAGATQSGSGGSTT